jgi:hypothetical protein
MPKVARALPTRRVVLYVVCAWAFLVLCYSWWPYGTARAPENAGPPKNAEPTEDHHITRPKLVLSLNFTESSIPSVRVTLTNYHFSTSVSVLVWDSPFDEQAVPLGVFKVADRSTGQEVPSMGLDISRLLAPKADDFVHLLPRHAVTKDVGLTPPGISLVSGKSYAVQVKSQWKGVWHADPEISSQQRLRGMGGPTGLVNWEYESNVLQLHVN